MATIEKLVLYDQQPDIVRNGNKLTTSQVWVLTLDERVSPIEADLMLYTLGKDNQYGFPAFTTTKHLDNPGLLSGGYKTARSDKGSERAGYLFKTTVSYSNGIEAVAQSEDPTDAAPIFRSENVRKEVEITVDPIAQTLIAASNGQLVFPRFTKNRILKRWIIMRNERTYNDIRSQGTVDKLNSDVININGSTYDPRALLLESWEGDPNLDVDGNQYFVCTYKFLVDVEELHQETYLDVSTERDLAGNLPPNAIPGKTVTRPSKLDGNGNYLPSDQQQDPTKFTQKKTWINEEIAMAFLNFRGRNGNRNILSLGTIPRRL